MQPRVRLGVGSEGRTAEMPDDDELFDDEKEEEEEEEEEEEGEDEESEGESEGD